MRFPTLAKDEIHRPIVALRLQGPTGRWANIDVLVDTGSDVCLFQESLAQRLGIDLESLPQRPLTSALGTVATYRSQELLLELRRFPDSIQWRGSVGFLLRPMTYGLLGTKGFLEFFQLVYDARQHTFEIVPSDRRPT